MKHNVILTVTLIMVLGIFSCNAQTNKKAEPKSTTSAKVELYYFHFSVRCATCHAVEDNSKAAFESLYPDKIRKGEYVFKGLNLDDAGSKAIAEKLGIGGQTLLIVCGDKKVDLTSLGFMYAHDQDKIKEEIKKAVEKVLKG